MKKCYIYTRVSTAAQVDGDSLEAQAKRLHDYASYKNREIAGEYCDAGKSGGSIRGRPEFQHRRWIDGHKCDYLPSLSEDKMNLAVEEVILDMTANAGFRDFVILKMGEEVDAGTLEQEREQLKVKLRQAVGAKNKLTQMLDSLDVADRHYERLGEKGFHAGVHQGD